ncbi:uncharacterized protein EAE98_003056 [Botrytis deweyae]|uniref:Uncharacterized protein n=1 Tax=Botrytis deweyae TaxID=2478750 RepID=A0ABQ7IVH4_9HELO|nr:uncharacterized protein EAE98_003056 [Botrytis deweyae]KAF7935011.1 hypothetical protein EAE98_003056 [Botrytis deweyae]
MEPADELVSTVERRAAYSIKRFRSSVDESVRKNDPKLWNRARMFIRSITQRYVNSINGVHLIDVFEIDLHDLWYLFVETAKITPANEAETDRLVNQVIYARELGEISRIVVPPAGESNKNQSGEQQNVHVESAITSTSARMRIDLPFLVTDLRDTWAISMMKMTMVERENPAALGVCDSELMSCALMLFRDALETPRQLLESDAALTADHANRIPLSEFLPAVLAWLWCGSYKILSLCARNEISFKDDSANDNREWAEAGQLIEASGERQHSGFNMRRWQFWKDRLEEISQNTESESGAEQGRKSVHIFESWEQITGGRHHDREIARDAFFGKSVGSV